MNASNPVGLKYRRILLKLSGEVFRDRKKDECIDPQTVESVAERVKTVHSLGVETAVVVGGGNIIRGANVREHAIQRAAADQMGMLATIINSLALQSALERAGLEASVQSAIEMPKVAETFTLRNALRHLAEGRVVIFAGGTGNPYFSTDTAAALRASEIRADVLLKATKVDGVYSADPARDKNAVRYTRIRYSDAIERSLRIMDASAFALCMENHIPILVFDFYEKDSFVRAVRGEEIGTLVCD